jgi:phosphodiesterase/alkaline phosphatase D-like protein
MKKIIFALLFTVCFSTLNAQTEFIWSGSVTPTSAKITTKIHPGSGNQKVAVQISTKKNFKGSTISKEVITNSSYRYFATIPLDGLKENSQYFYRVMINGKADERQEATGTFKTFKNSPFSFTFGVGSCAKSDKAYPAFATIANEKPLFFLYTGDFHYGNVESDCEKNMDYFFSEALRNRNNMHKEMPVAYMWDDHDYGPNDSDATNPCRVEAIQNYKNIVPHYPIAIQGQESPVSQSFVVGNMRFILSDLRSQKVKPKFKNCDKLSTGTMFGTTEGDSTHLNWFKNELLKAKELGQYPVWISGVPYINHEGGPNYRCNESDNWGGFPEERNHISEFLEKHEIQMLILSGDTHMVAIDDGTNTNYAENGKLKNPIFHSSSLGGKKGSYKGGPYSHGYKVTPAKVDDMDLGQYAIIKVKQKSKSVEIEFIGKDQDGKVILNENDLPLRYKYSVKL